MRDVVVVVVCAVFALLLLSVGAWIGRMAERRAPRRGGLLELDTPAVRRLRGFAGRDELEVRDPGDAA